MSPKSRYKRSRDHWKDIAVKRGERERYSRKELNRVKKDRDRLKKKLKETRTLLKELEAQSKAVVVEHKVDLVFVALQLFLVARIGFRAVSRVLGLLAQALGIKKAPCPQTVINWVIRLSLVRIQSTPLLNGPTLERAPFSNGLIWMIDTSIALGTGKILTVLALNAHHHRLLTDAPGFVHVHCIAVSVADSWTGETIAALLRRIIGVMGRPTAYLKDGGSDLQKAVEVLDKQELGSPCIDDISHVVANILKYWYEDHPMFHTFLSACGQVSGKLKQTLLACLAPPKVQTKSRFMKVHRLVAWADQLLKHSPPGGARKGSILSKLRACLDRLPSCRDFIKRFGADAAPLLECQKILKAEGLSHDTLARCESLIQSIPSAGVRRDFLAYLYRQLDVAAALGLDDIGMPISSDSIESLFGLAKQHGVGQIKDADRIALRLPALCGPAPTRAEAQQVLHISVAQQKEITDPFTSLIKQRRDVLPHPGRIESLSDVQGQAHVKLIPSAKSRAIYPKIVELSRAYQDPDGPRFKWQSGYYSP